MVTAGRTNQTMSNFNYTFHGDGTVDLMVGGITLKGIIPYVDERPVLPVSYIIEKNIARITAAEGTIVLSVREEDDELILSVSADGFDHVHDIEPVGRAEIIGADHVYVQGFGMEGPSGYHLIDGQLRVSHGITGLAGDNSAAAVFATDHRRYGTSFSIRSEEKLYSHRAVFSAGVNLEGTASGHVDLPELHFITGSSVDGCMRRAAEKIAHEMDARTSAPPAFHWCSWYYHYENMSQEILDELLAGLSKDNAGFRHIQLDAGYTDHIGDWKTINHRYPSGLEGAAKSILAAGYEPGIWIAPFLVGDQSDTYRSHPDWILRNTDGTPRVVFRSYTEPKIWGNTDNDYYILDVTNPGAFSYLREVFSELRQYGYTLYKIDFILWGMADSSEVIRYDNSLTSAEVLRRALAMIRDVTGKDSYILGSIAPFMPCIGYADGMRIASDMGAQWTDGAFGPANLLQELPFDNYFNNIFWQNDPDSVILRDFATHLTEEETRSIALLQALSGGIITTSDHVTRLSPERRALLDFIRPGKDRAQPRMPALTGTSEEIVITHSLHDWNLLFVLNPCDHPVRVFCRMDELFVTQALFQYRYDWHDGTDIESEKCSCFSESIQPHESALFFITEEPLREKPSNLWYRR